MPLQNRVLPTGEIVADPARGTFMGNRTGQLHDADRRLGSRRWTGPMWITCRLDFRGRHRSVMSPGHYTELFFLDEAVAFAAGHRPCAECRRADYLRFRAAFDAVHGDVGSATGMDRILHAARVTRARRQITHEADFDSLADGSFVTLQGESWLVLDNMILRYTPAAYVERRPRPTGRVTVLTPVPTVASLAAGYRPAIHESARA